MTVSTTQDQKAHKARVACAAGIANLEGRSRIALPTDIIAQSTLQALSDRLRGVELQVADDSLAASPCTDTTWESLAWRIWVAEGRLLRTVPKKVVSHGPVRRDMMPDADAVSIQTLQQLCGDLVRRCAQRFPIPLREQPCKPWVCHINDGLAKEDETGKDTPPDQESQTLEIMRQTIFHVAGRNDWAIGSTPVTRAELYFVMAELCIFEDCPANRFGRAMPPRVLPPPGTSRIIVKRVARKKGNCGFSFGFCRCECHNPDSDSDSDSVTTSSCDSSSSDSNGSTLAQGTSRWRRGFGWLRALVCRSRPKEKY